LVKNIRITQASGEITILAMIHMHIAEVHILIHVKAQKIDF